LRAPGLYAENGHVYVMLLWAVRCVANLHAVARMRLLADTG
jgi:hypothetical protein